MSDGPSQVYSALDALGIVYTRYDHPPVFTGEDAALHWADIPARGMKNLFLRNKKGDRHYLVILPIEKEADLRRLVKLTRRRPIQLCVTGPARQTPWAHPGSVSPFEVAEQPVALGPGHRGHGPARRQPADLPSESQLSQRDYQRSRPGTIPQIDRARGEVDESRR